MCLYEKALLYVYPHLEKIAANIDEVVAKKALGSFSNFEPCLIQAEKIIGLINNKISLINLKIALDEILSRFSDEELKYFEYKYFKNSRPERFVGFDTASRNYFRRQIKVFNKFCNLLIKKGMDEQWFNDNYLTLDFMKQMIKRVKQCEEDSMKNRKKTAVAVPLKSDSREYSYV